MNLVDAHIHLPTYGRQTEVVEAAEATGTLLVSCTVNSAEAAANHSLFYAGSAPRAVRALVGLIADRASEGAGR